MDNGSMLRIYSMGFFLYPYRATGDGETTAPYVVAPHADGHLLKAVLIQGKAVRVIEFKTGCTVRVKPDGKDVAPENGSTRVKRERLIDGMPPAGESGRGGKFRWENFDMVPDREYMCRPTILRPNWREAQNIDLTLLLEGGELTAVPDAHTTTKRFRWSGGHRQVVSGLTRYQVPLQKGVVSFGDTDVEVTGGSVIVLLHIAKVPDTTEYTRYLRGLQHHMIVLGLCEAESQVIIDNAIESDPITAPDVILDEYEYVKTAKKAVYETLGLKTPDETREGGYPSCNGRKIAI